MKNDDFRKLVSSTSAGQENGSTPTARPGALGAKKSAFLGMTPRPGKAPSSNDFAKQVREQHAAIRPPKKYKSSAPKGSKFAAGYIDRAKARQEAGDAEDDKAKRIKALEEQVKLGQLPQETFEALRDEITGGDLSSTHLVKGLDRKLLERVRRGEDVLGTKQAKALVDVDNELEKLGEKELEAVKREQAEKRGIKAVSPVAGKKRSRDEILAELKAQRQAAAAAKAASAPVLDSRWRRVGDAAKPKVEIDKKGREVVTVVQEDGTVKKMIKKPQNAAEDGRAATGLPDASKPVLGADVVLPAQKQPEPDEDSDEDIFAGAGTEYNPLAGIDDDDDSDSDDDDDAKPAKVTKTTESTPRARSPSEDDSDGPEQQEDAATAEAKPTASAQLRTSRNYFGAFTATAADEDVDRFKGVENVLKKAARLGAERSGADEDEDEDDREGESKEERDARLAKRKRMLSQQDRDADDMDMGFGGSRMEDEEDFGESKIKLSEWKGGKAGGDDGWEEEEKGAGKKKRKPKKRKGDVNNAADIMRVIEGRKAGADNPMHR